MHFEIAIIGAGQIGSRHLQACALLQNAAIYIVDPDNSSLETARQRFEEIKSASKVEINYCKDILDLPSNIDVCIVATNSVVRRAVIESVISHCKVRYFILEKILFQRIEDYAIISDLFIAHQIKAWVNCPRRIFDVYDHIKNSIDGPISMFVSGNEWGLASNGIHFIDLFQFLCNSSDPYTIHCEALNNNVYESKRSGFDEYKGTISIQSGENALQISCFDGDFKLPSVVIYSQHKNWLIVESSPSYFVDLSDTKSELNRQYFDIPFQSKLTNQLIEQIMQTGSCGLATYEESMSIHIPFISSLMAKHSLIAKKEVDICNIT